MKDRRIDGHTLDLRNRVAWEKKKIGKKILSFFVKLLPLHVFYYKTQFLIAT